MKYLARNFESVDIMLGTECNLGCRYCIQKYQKTPKLSDQINEDVYGFLKQISDENPSEKPVHITFTGGEPTLRMDSIREILRHTSDCRFTYSILTNGKLLDEQLVESFNEHHVGIHVSWDGKASSKTRGYDVMREKEDVLLLCDELMLNGVASAAAYPKDIFAGFEAFNKKYMKVHGYGCMGNINFVDDPGIPDRTLAKIDEKRVYDDMYELTLSALTELDEESVTRKFIMEYLQSLDKKVAKGEPYDMFRGCGGGYVQLNLDLAGNLYECHNTFVKAGDIYTPYFKYLSSVVASDCALPKRSECRGCVAEFICHDACAAGACRLTRKDDGVLAEKCKTMKAAARGIIQATLDASEGK